MNDRFKKKHRVRKHGNMALVIERQKEREKEEKKRERGIEKTEAPVGAWKCNFLYGNRNQTT